MPGGEQLAQDTWTDARLGRPLPERVSRGAALDPTPFGPGSQNIARSLNAARVYWCAHQSTLPADTREVCNHAREILRLEREEVGIQSREPILGYSMFHLVAVVALATAAKVLIQRGEAWAIDLLEDARDWIASWVAILHALRVEDGQILTLGSRVQPLDEMPQKGVVPMMALHILNPLPLGDLVQWLAALAPPGLATDRLPTARPAGVKWYWGKPAISPDEDVLWMLLKAIEIGAIVPMQIRAAALGRRPLVAAEVYRWSTGGVEYAAATRMAGLGPRCWLTRYRRGRIETLVSEPKGSQSGGSGWHHAPAEVLREIRADVTGPLFRVAIGEQPPPAKPAPPAKPKPPKPSKPKEKPVPKKKPKPKPAPAPPPAGEADPRHDYREQLLDAVGRWGRPGGPTTADIQGLLNVIAEAGL
jgi:hypothetical protein